MSDPGSTAGKLIRDSLDWERGFARIPNSWLRDERLSYKARGLLALLMSHDAGWEVTVKSLAHTTRDGKASVQTAVQELEQFGYVSRKQQRTKGGRLSHVEWHITDPEKPANSTIGPYTDFPSTGKPSTAKPSPVNQPTLEEQLPEDLITALETTTREPVDNSASGLDEIDAYGAPVIPLSRWNDDRCPASLQTGKHEQGTYGHCVHCFEKPINARKGARA